MTESVNQIDPLPVPLHSTLPGHVINTSCNVILALGQLMDYLNSLYGNQIADANFEQMLSTTEAAIVHQFEQDMNNPDPPTDAHGDYSNWLWLLTHYTGDNSDGTLTKYAQAYAACSAENQAETKVMDGENSVAQNTMNQNSQGQQGVIQAMTSVLGINGNLLRLLQA